MRTDNLLSMVGPIFTDFDLADHIGQDRLNLEFDHFDDNS